MSIRTKLAGMAMQGFLSLCATMENYPDADIVAARSVGYADALIEELNK